MFARIIMTGALLALAGALAAPAGAQQSLVPASSGSMLSFSPYAGYMAYGRMLDGPVGTSLVMKSNPVYGAQLGLAIAPNVALYGNVGYSKTNLQVGVPILGGVNVGNSSVWMYDGGLQLDIPTSSRSIVTPFVQAGAGAMHYDISAANLIDVKTTNFAWNAGAGLDVKLAPTVGMRLMAKDYIGRFNFQDATTVGTIQGRMAQNWAFTGGFTIGF